ncbi:unnamed protein product [Rotaria magnacalcarata]|uniref:Uncharacterized protein n=1 Tax=Rotaria magnacalcarata TaxID=392030 RepID=A0A816MSK1_9BILA|nr:unnamed protein product [Rotaria magnacalcarata]CAF1593864.1 unnamed protein product [Rotaria magnacalcarata]CAF2025045.1 unnamed protein product [Rotaria magnacalcarata]CAF2116739.1 unnamed protein product [Rotaria magnacalcarata]CAF2117592.1 unnamed protein product [Rotaria magnacalcarata]
MAESENHHIGFQSTQKPRSSTTSLHREPRKLFLSSNNPNNKGNGNESRSRGRLLWNVAVEGVLEREKFTPNSTSMASFTNNNAPVGWYNLTKR